MKKLLCLIILALFTALPAMAEEIVVTLNDGADIPYFEGFQSQIVKDAASIKGITGAAHATWEHDIWSDKRGDYVLQFELQNILLTDDMLVFFYLTHSEIPFTDEEINSDFMPIPVFCRFEDNWLDWLTIPVREAHPTDDYTLACMMGYSLSQPIAPDQTLVLEPVYDEKTKGYIGGTRIKIEQGMKSDPITAYTPVLHVFEIFAPYEGAALVTHDFIVQRIAFTPFGNRILIDYLATSEENARIWFELADDQDRNLPIFQHMSPTPHAVTLATPKNPVNIRYDVWFTGGEDASSLTFLPREGAFTIPLN